MDAIYVPCERDTERVGAASHSPLLLGLCHRLLVPLLCIRPELFSQMLPRDLGCQALQIPGNLSIFRPGGQLCCADHERRRP